MKILVSIIVVLFFYFLIFSCSTGSQSSDDDEFMGYLDRVSFSEVYLDTTDYSKTWIELYNPTGMDIQVDGGRYSHMRCINCLPRFIVAPKSYLVLCANDSVFNANYGEIDNLLEISVIGALPKPGGYFSIYTQPDTLKLYDAFRFGNLCTSNTKDWFEGSDLLPFLAGDSSCSLTVLGKSELCNLYKFEKTSPTPGF